MLLKCESDRSATTSHCKTLVAFCHVHSTSRNALSCKPERKSETFFSFGGYRVTFIDEMSQWQIAATTSSTSCSLDSMHFSTNAEKVVKVNPNNESRFIFISASSSPVVFMICCAVRHIYTCVFIICTIIETGLPGIIIYRFE